MIDMGLNLRRILFRSWFYFRVGYGTYIALLIGIASNLLLFYRLGVQDIKSLGEIFPSLTIFSVIAVLIAVPISIGVGLYHMKRTGAFAADASVSTESNPYMYRIIPGKEQEVLYPLIMMTAKGLVKVLDRQEMITPSEKRDFEEALAKASVLLHGQPVGLPARLAKSARSGQRDE